MFRALVVLLASLVAVPLTGTATRADAAVLQSSSYGASSDGPERFPIPSGARFVAPWGSDSNSGTSSSPYRTIQRAVRASPAGATIVIRGGTYRESVGWFSKALTLQNYPGEAVYLSGSDTVNGWTADGSAWRRDNWNHKYNRTSDPDLVRSEHPLAAFPDQVFDNGVPLEQVGSRSAVRPGTFFADYANNRLYIGNNPSGRHIEASVRKRGLHLNQAHGSAIRGITVQRYANHYSEFGAAFIDAAHVTLEGVRVRQNAAIGASVFGADARVTRSTFSDNGQMGLHGHRANNLDVTRSALIRNNAEGFVSGGTARVAEGGAKVTTSNRVRFTDNLVEGNRGKGVWVDEDSFDIRYLRNIVRHNGGTGLYVEISARAIIASNLVAHNRGVGVAVTESADVDVYNNTFYRNAGRHLSMVENNRTSSNRDIPRDLRAVQVRNNIFSDTVGDAPVMVGVEDVTRTRNGHQLGVTLDYNAYHRTHGAAPRWWIGWASYPDAFYNATSYSEFRSRTGQEANGGMVQSDRNPFFVNGDGDDLALSSEAKSTYRGVGLPSHVAAALGLPAGHRPPLGALHVG